MFSISTLASHVIKHICVICDKKDSNKKKIKKLIQVVLGKGLFVSVKDHLHLANVGLQMKIKSTSLEEFLILLIQIFKKKPLFNKLSDIWTLYLSKTLSER